MDKEKFLTIRWNNWLTLGLGIPALIYIITAFSTSRWTEKSSLLWLAAVGILY